MEQFFLVLRIVVGTVCVLSIGGASLIIVTFVAFKDLRTLARQQLVNLSVADILVAGSHLLGLAALRVENYPTTYTVSDNSVWLDVPYGNETEPGKLCIAQAVITMCGTIASFLWSLALGFFMLSIIVFRRPDIARFLLFFYYPVCWLVPLSLSLLFALLHPTPLGYAPKSDIGWCYGRIVPNATHTERVGLYLLGYGLWFGITIIALVVIYLTMLCYLKFRNSQRMYNTRGQTDYKLVLVPLIFFLLRIWSVVLDIDTYNDNPQKSDSKYSSRDQVFSILAGIGDSAQGLANAVLFCVFTKQVRERLKKSLLSCICCCCPNFRNRVGILWIKGSLNSSGHITSHETTTQLETDSLTGSNRTNPLLTPTEQDHESDRSALLRASYNGDPFEDRKYGTAAHRTRIAESY